MGDGADFGRAVRVYRGLRQFSQEELADRSGLHRTYISEVERGRRNISLASIMKLANALDVTPGRLVDPVQGFTRRDPRRER